MHEPIEQLGRCLDDRYVRYFGGVLVCTVQVRSGRDTPDQRAARRTRLDIQHHLHRLLPEGHHRVQASEVEVVLDEILGYFAEVFMAGQRAEPTDPGQRRCRRR